MDIQKYKRGLGLITQPLKYNYSRGMIASDSFWYELDDTDVSPGSLLKHYKHWVYSCASRNATAVASAKLRLYVNSDEPYNYLRKGIDTKATKIADVEEVINHPFLDLLHKPNPICDSQFEFFEILQLFLELTGDAYIYLWNGSLGVPSEMYVLPSQYMRVVPSKTKFIKGYLYGTSTTNAVALKPEEVIHFKFPNPNDLFYGRSPLEAAFASVMRKEKMDDYENSLLKNNARPDFLLISKGRMTEEQKRSLREQWSALYGTKQGRGKPAVATSDLEVKELAFSPKEMAFLKGRTVSKEEIFDAFGNPLTKSDPKAANRASALVAERQYQRDTIKPRLIRIKDKFNSRLLSRFDSRLFVNYDENIPEDKELLAKEREIYAATGVLTKDEIREQMGYGPLEEDKVSEE